MSQLLRSSSLSTEIRSSLRYPHFRGRFVSVFTLQHRLHVLYLLRSLLTDLRPLFNNSVSGISQRRWLDRCVFRTGRRKTRERPFLCFFKRRMWSLDTGLNVCHVLCFRYGTGCFLLRNTGPKVRYGRL